VTLVSEPIMTYACIVSFLQQYDPCHQKVCKNDPKLTDYERLL